MYKQIGFGGGCHWCTEAVFQSLKGIQTVVQGWIASAPPNDDLSEAVVVTYDPAVITLEDLITIHLYTHAATSNHSMRHKYRSAVYWFGEEDAIRIQESIAYLGADFKGPIITQVLPFAFFKASLPEHQNYYYGNPEKPFCTAYIHPKLQLLRAKFYRFTRQEEAGE